MTMPQQGGVNLGSAFGQIVISDNIDAAVGNASRAFDNALSGIGQSMQRIGSQMSGVGQQITIATAPLAIFGIQGIQAASRYEDAMKEIEVRAGLTVEQLAMVASKTEEIGIRSQFGPAQAADAFLQLLSSGSSVEEAMLQIDSVIDGAAASGQELGFVADALTDVMAAFGLEASESASVMQTLIDATGSSSATFPDLIAGFSNVGPAARNAGLSIEETAAALAVFAENGIKGAEGGTQLKTVLTALQSDKAATELERLGVTITDVEGNIRPLNDIIVDLNTSMDGMTEAERNQTIMELAGSYGQLGLSALLAEGGIQEMVDTMDEQAAIADIAAARMETFSGAIAFTEGSVELLQIRALRPLMQDTLRPLILMIGEVVNKISDWIVANPELAQQIIRVLAVLTVLGPVLIILGQAVSFIGGALVGLGTLLAFVLSPIGLLILAITALGVAFATNFMGIRDLVMPIVHSIIGTMNQLFQIFTNRDFVGGGLLAEDGPITDMLFRFRDAVTSVVTTIQSVFSGLVNAFQTGGLQDVADFIGQIFNDISSSIASTNWAQVGIDIMSAIGNAFNTATGLVFDWATWVMTNFITPLINNIVSSTGSVDWSAIGTGILNGIGAVLSAFSAWGAWLNTNLFTQMISNVATAVSGVDWLAVGSSILDAIGTALSTVFQWGTWFVTNVLTPMITNAQTAIEGIDWFSVGENVMNAIGSALMATFNFVTWLIDSIFSPITENTDSATGQIDWSGVGTSILNGIGAFLSGVFDFVSWLTNTILLPLIAGASTAIQATDWSAVGSSIMSSLGTSLGNIGQWVTTNIITPIRNSLANFNPMNAVQGAGNALNNFATGAGNMFGNFGNALQGNVPGFADGINVLPRDMLVQAHAGEAIIPASFNPYNPDAQQPNAGGGGVVFESGSVVVQANDAQGGQAAGDAFSTTVINRLREAGLNPG